MNKKFFTIVAGSKERVKVLVGTINKLNGQPAPGAQEAEIGVGKILVLNYSTVWGRRIAEPSDTSKKKEGKVSVTDPDYKGKIEFLTWGDAKGEQIEIRFLPHSNSLDKQYQDNVQKLSINDERDIYIKLDQGINDIDENIHPLLVQFLKVCSANKNSKSRNPMVNECEFSEYSEGAASNREAVMLARHKAEKRVMDAKGNEGRLAVLAHLYPEDSTVDVRKQPGILYDALLDKAVGNPDLFNELCDRYTNALFITLTDGIKFELASIEKKGVLEVLNGDKLTTALKDVEGEGDKKIAAIIDRAFEPEVYQAYITLQAAVADRMKALAN